MVKWMIDNFNKFKKSYIQEAFQQCGLNLSLNTTLEKQLSTNLYSKDKIRIELQKQMKEKSHYSDYKYFQEQITQADSIQTYQKTEEIKKFVDANFESDIKELNEDQLNLLEEEIYIPQHGHETVTDNNGDINHSEAEEECGEFEQQIIDLHSNLIISHIDEGYIKQEKENEDKQEKVNEDKQEKETEEKTVKTDFKNKDFNAIYFNKYNELIQLKLIKQKINPKRNQKVLKSRNSKSKQALLHL